MNFIKKLTSFFNLGDLKLKQENYNVEKFQEDLLYFNKVIRKTYFKYDETTFQLDKIYEDNKKGIKLSVDFTDGKGSVTYTFKDVQENELLTIYTNGKTHSISMNEIQILNKEQINTLFEMIQLNKVFNNVTKLCNDEISKQEIINENNRIKKITGDNLQLDISNEILNKYKKNNDIYFNIISLSIDKVIKEKKLNLDNNDFLNFDLKNSKDKTISVEDIYINLTEFKHESIQLKLISKKYQPYFDADDAFAYRNVDFTFSKNNEKFLEMMLTYHQDELLKNNNKVSREIKFSVITKSKGTNKLEIKNSENKNKILNFIQVFPLLEDTVTLLQKKNFQLDKLIQEKENDLRINHNLSTNIIEEKIIALKDKLKPKLK